jgi:hypothetical protein
MSKRVPVAFLVVLLSGGAGLAAARLFRGSPEPHSDPPPVAPAVASSPAAPDGGITTTTAGLESGSDAAVVGGSSGADFDVSGNLAALSGGKVVAVVSGATVLRTEVLAEGTAVTRYVAVTIDDLLFVVDRAAAPHAAEWRWRDLDLPDLQIGSTLTLRQTYSPLSEEGFDYELPEGPLLLSASYLAFWQDPGGDPIFAISLAASVSPDGSLEFLHRDYAAAHGEQWDRLVSHLDWQGSEAELVAAWAAEAWANADTDVRGPILTAFIDSIPRPPTDLERWNATDPRQRSIMPGVAPPEVLEGLIEIRALVDLVGEARPADRYLYVRTDLGIIHAAHIPGGSHQAIFLAPPGSTWGVYIATDELGYDETLIARIRPEEWSTATDGARLLIRIDDASILTPAPIDQADDPHGIVSIVDAAEAADILMSWGE